MKEGRQKKHKKICHGKTYTLNRMHGVLLAQSNVVHDFKVLPCVECCMLSSGDSLASVV
jgi:hypothetical protein